MLILPRLVIPGPAPSLLLLCVGLLLFHPPVAAAQDPPMWGELQAGPHAVGFRSSWILDPARRYRRESDSGGRVEVYDGPRPILVNHWYPARPSDVAPMPHEDYFTIHDARFPALSAELATYARRICLEQWVYADRESMTEAEFEAAEGLLRTPTACRRNATPADGSFPLVLFHSGYGSSFEDNAVLCEYLASHGFVVLGSAFQKGDGSSFNIDAGAGSFRDLEALIRHVQSSSQIDVSRIAMVGHSGGAHTALHFGALPNAALDGVVSLDTTQDAWSAFNPRWKHPAVVLERAEEQTHPLMIAAPPYAHFDLYERLPNCERFYWSARALEHNDYISQGILHAELAVNLGVDHALDPPEEGQPPHDLIARAAALRRSYEALNRATLSFLQYCLLDQSAARTRWLAEYGGTPLGGERPHGAYLAAGAQVRAEFNEDTPGLPSPRQFRTALDALGAEALMRRMREDRDAHTDAGVGHHEFGMSLLVDLFEQGRVEDARCVAAFYRERYPWLGRLMFNFSKLYTKPHYHALQRLHLLTAQALSPEDEEIQAALQALQ